MMAECNEETPTPSSSVFSQSKVEADEEKLVNPGNSISAQKSPFELLSVTSSPLPYDEQIYAAETLLKMANHESLSSNFVEGNPLCVERKFAHSEDDPVMIGCGLSSNSLAAFSGKKQNAEINNANANVRNQRRKIDVDSSYVKDRGGLCSNWVSKQRKQEQPLLITPTIHKGFSFSIIQLLSAVRLALVAPTYDDGSLFFGKGSGKENILTSNQGLNHNNTHKLDILMSKRINYLSVDEIVEQVRLRIGGDPEIPRTKECLRLVDLVRGAMKILSSHDSPPLAAYNKAHKGWCWIGPPVQSSSIEQAWGLPQKKLVKLVDSFADWLKTNQEALEQLGRLQLQPPPLALTLIKFNLKERVLGALKLKGKNCCSPTIKPTPLEVRAYFRSEERVRYMIPERAFAYTTVDGRKSTVAPLRKCGETLSTRAREHSLLKPDRPGSITLLTVVRDAAARLPGGIGTRGDVAVLVRDSQYVKEGCDVSDEQLGQMVSGGLDRLHYERDPCVMFDRKRRLWVYLHGEREEEDFDDDGRRSTIVRGANRHE